VRFEYLLQIVARIDARQHGHPVIHVTQQLARNVLRCQVRRQRDQSHVKLAEHSEVLPLTHRRVDTDVRKPLFGNQALEPRHFTAVADQQETDVRPIAQGLGQPDDVVHVLRHADVSAVEVDRFSLQAEVAAVISLRYVVLVGLRPVIQDLEAVLVGQFGCLRKILQVGRRLHGDHVGDAVLGKLPFPEEPPRRPAAPQHARIDRPLREDVPENHVRRAAPQLLELPDDAAEEDARRVEDHQVARVPAEILPAAAPQDPRQHRFVHRPLDQRGALDPARADPKNCDTAFLAQAVSLRAAE